MRTAAAGAKVNIWNAVKTARDLNVNGIPSNLLVGGVPVAAGCSAQAFGSFFSNKIKSNISKTNVRLNGVYNGKNKLIVQNRNFIK